jgi:formylglycine-generating enzyme required for sulfatase activity
MIGWYDNNSGSKTHSVGGKLANSYGLYDMCGNVWELTMDWHGTYPEGPVTDPAGADTGSLSIRRGGSCYGYARYGRSAYRGYATLTVRYTDLGFRLSRSK